MIRIRFIPLLFMFLSCAIIAGEMGSVGISPIFIMVFSFFYCRWFPIPAFEVIDEEEEKKEED